MLNSRMRNIFKLVKRNAIQKFILPDLGEKIKEATVVKWHVKEGDSIEEFDTIADVSTDKLFTEIPSPYKGVIHKLNYLEEESCNVGDVLLEIETFDDEEIIEEKEIIEKTENSIKSGTYEEKRDQIINVKVLAAPTVRHFAKSNNVDISLVKGTEKNGRITKDDIINHMEDIKKKQTPKIQKRTIETLEKKVKKETKIKEVIPLNNLEGITNEINMNMFEQGMVKSMNYSTTVPFLGLHEEYDVSKIIKLRKEYNLSNNKKVSVFAFFVKCFSLAIKEIPKMNSNYYPEKDKYKYIINESQNISFAVDSKNGLAAPNVKNIQDLSIEEIDSEIKNLSNIATEGRLTSQHLEGGTIGLSNIGSIGGIFATPLALPYQTTIVALGKVKKSPLWNGEQFIPIDVLPVSFSCDHRVLDGATVAKFALVWKKYIENPSLLITKLR